MVNSAERLAETNFSQMFISVPDSFMLNPIQVAGENEKIYGGRFSRTILVRAIFTLSTVVCPRIFYHL